MTMSCIEELDVPYPADENLTTLVPRVKSFTNQYVTKADGNSETDIKTLSALIFDNDGKFVDLRTGSTSVTINKSMLNSPANQGRLTSATIVMFANVSLDDIKDADGKSIRENLSTLTLANVDGYSCHFAEAKTVITDLASFADGLPMTGRAEGVNLTPSRDQQGPVTVNLQILYAKINFSIGVENGSENTGSGMKFAMTGYSVHNASKVTALAEPEGATASDDYAYTSSGKTGSKSGTVNLDGTPLTFTFYVAESRYEHNSDLRGIYPDDDWLTSVPGEDVKGYNDETDKGRLNGVKYFYDDLIQQYKPKLAGLTSGKPGQGKATYVLLKGTYTDYRGTAWTVNYKVYLGKDNAVNFHVDRNSEYTNHITIKGIRNNDSHGNGDVWVDHRVNVSTTDPAGYVTITRETLIDAHIEVRPLRVKWEEGKYAGVRVYLPTKTDGTLENWIGIERFTGSNCQESSTYCYADGKSTGKRRYFTADLISELQTKGGQFGVSELDGKKFVYLQNGDCAWIYFDEHVSFISYPTQPSPARSAQIKLEFVDDNGEKKAEEIYNVEQLGLQRKGGWNVEAYEEYLHSYDSADKYNLSTTPADYTQQGLSWGLADRTISQSILASVSPLQTTILGQDVDLAQYVNNIPQLGERKYDYYHDTDGSYYRYIQDDKGDWVVASGDEKHSGLSFTDRATENTGTTIKDMGSIPENAYQYCLSKNKFEVDDEGNVKMVLKWYLPDVHQLSSVLLATSNTSADFRSEDFYWSSQPSFDDDYVYSVPLTSYSIGLMTEDPSSARAASKSIVGTNSKGERATVPQDKLRTEKHRIRCLYAYTSTTVPNMTDRIPDGVGGLISVNMKAWNNGSSGYFNYLLPASPTEKESSSDWVYNDDRGTNYPNKDNASSISGEKFKYIKTTDKDENPIEGFNINPGETSSWTEYDPVIGSPDGYYTTLTKYPGLTESTVQKRNVGDAYKPTGTPKSGTQTDTTKFIKKLDKKLPSASDLRTLDHLKGGSRLNISFNQSQGSTLPVFVYDEVVSGTTTTNKRTWIKPTYTFVNHPMKSEEKTISAKGSASESGSSEGTRYGGSIDKARQNAFDGSLSNGWNGAYEQAKQDALTKLKNEINKNYSGWDFIESDVTYTPLTYKSTSVKLDDGTIAVKYSSESESKYLTCKSTCTVTLYATVTIKKTSELKLFHQDANTGMWKDQPGNPVGLDNSINTDELRMYSGNSLTISLSDATDEDGVKYSEGYQITKVKIYYSGDNKLLEQTSGIIGQDKTTVYARFVDESITLPVPGDQTSHLGGWDYDDTNKTQQWAGSGTDSVTLTLADYVINQDRSLADLGNILTGKYTYTYEQATHALSKHIVIDRIDVKCTKKATASE